jgi:hypothetical protein
LWNDCLQIEEWSHIASFTGASGFLLYCGQFFKHKTGSLYLTPNYFQTYTEQMNVVFEDSVLIWGFTFLYTLFIRKKCLIADCKYKLVSELLNKTLLLTLIGNFLEGARKHGANE